jgi:hypothetical protein
MLLLHQGLIHLLPPDVTLVSGMEKDEMGQIWDLKFYSILSIFYQIYNLIDYIH